MVNIELFILASVAIVVTVNGIGLYIAGKRKIEQGESDVRAKRFNEMQSILYFYFATATALIGVLTVGVVFEDIRFPNDVFRPIRGGISVSAFWTIYVFMFMYLGRLILLKKWAACWVNIFSSESEHNMSLKANHIRFIYIFGLIGNIIFLLLLAVADLVHFGPYYP